MQRRQFLSASSAILAAAPFAQSAAANTLAPRRVGVIGHTGRGNFGHGLDTVWLRIPETKIVGLADGGKTGLQSELKKLQLQPEQSFVNYHEMLEQTKPEFVSVCPRHVDQHAAMTIAAIEAGVRGVYCEKPFCQTLEQADQVAEACERHGAKVAVAHRNRYHPTLPVIKEIIDSGEIGPVIEFRGKGKGDRRGGAEDLWVLGGHVLNIFQFLAGDPVSCSALVRNKGELVTAADVYEGAEGIGKIAGDEIRARFEFASGTIGYYDSVVNDGTMPNGYALQIVCGKGTIVIHIDAPTLAHLIPGNPYQPKLNPQAWVPISTQGIGQPETQSEYIANVANHVVAAKDLIAACDEDRQPLCDLRQATSTVEMFAAVFESHRRNGARVTLPLEDRGNPLEKL